jgi:hypothetical protein
VSELESTPVPREAQRVRRPDFWRSATAAQPKRRAARGSELQAAADGPVDQPAAAFSTVRPIARRRRPASGSESRYGPNLCSTRRSRSSFRTPVGERCTAGNAAPMLRCVLPDSTSHQDPDWRRAADRAGVPSTRRSEQPVSDGVEPTRPLANSHRQKEQHVHDHRPQT